MAAAISVEKVLQLRDAIGRLCGTYHYDDPDKPFFKSFFRGLYTPKGYDVVAPPPPEDPLHARACNTACALRM